MKIEAVKVRRLYLDVANQLENLIVSGEIKSGERLPSERDLATQFEVSRPTIREAMIALEIAGLVEIRTGSGIFVLDNKPKKAVPISDDGPGPFEILEARKLIESETAMLATARITDKQLDELHEALLVMENEGSKDSISEQADQRFHCIIAEAAGNSALSAAVNWLWELRNKSGLSTLFHQRVREMGVHPSIEEHRRIYQALKKRDPSGAKLAMQEHLSFAIEQNEALLDNGKS